LILFEVDLLFEGDVMFEVELLFEGDVMIEFDLLFILVSVWGISYFRTIAISGPLGYLNYYRTKRLSYLFQY